MVAQDSAGEAEEHGDENEMLPRFVLAVVGGLPGSWIERRVPSLWRASRVETL